MYIFYKLNVINNWDLNHQLIKNYFSSIINSKKSKLWFLVSRGYLVPINDFSNIESLNMNIWDKYAKF